MSKKSSFVRLTLFPALLVALLAIQPGTRATLAAGNGAGATAPPDVQEKHVFLVMLENHSYSSVIGNTSMPYLNSLAKTNSYASWYFASTHPSIGNYFAITAGHLLTNNDAFTGTVTADNLARHMIAAGKTWKEYSEGLPYVGYTGGDTGYYTEHHNPFSYFSDVRNSVAERNNLVPFTEFSSDIVNNRLPQFSFIVPDNKHNGHDCPTGYTTCTDNQRLAAVDSWLQTNLHPLISSLAFSSAHGGLLVIVFDEALESDKTYGGGHVAWVAVGPDVKKGHTSWSYYGHTSTLRLLSEAIGLTTFPGNAATAADMEEFINGD